MIDLIVERDGSVRMIYDETIDVRSLGDPTIRRGSYVEPAKGGRWKVDLTPMNGPVLGPFTSRSVALEEEVAWLRSKWLLATPACNAS